MLSPELASPLELNDVGRYIVDDAWVMEQKLDGHRIMLVSPAESMVDRTPAFLTRNGTEYTKGVPAKLHDHGLPPGFIVDGELVNGVLWIFDVIHLNGNLETLPLSERRKVLEAIPETSVMRRVPQAVGTEAKERLLLQAATLGYEGVVLKRLASPYERNRRSPDWLKAKFVVTADVIVLTVADDGKESASLGAVGKDGKTIVEVGRCSLIGKPTVVPGDVVEVRYLYANDPAKPRLYQPTLLKVRDDKTPPECSVDQLRFTNKTVMETLV